MLQFEDLYYRLGQKTYNSVSYLLRLHQLCLNMCVHLHIMIRWGFACFRKVYERILITSRFRVQKENIRIIICSYIILLCIISIKTVDFNLVPVLNCYLRRPITHGSHVVKRLLLTQRSILDIPLFLHMHIIIVVLPT